MKNIQVSVICAAYNHERYIRKTLDGFINQKTNFKYEVLIHDDCSTDNTTNIIKEYEQKYPNIIKPIYQTDNQYSKGINIFNVFLLPKIQGKYIAMCEGDDCWIDENKLQMQYDYMESHEDCFLITSACRINNLYTGEQKDRILSDEDRDYNFEECLCDELYFNTCTFFMKKEVRTSMPKCFNIPGVGDIQMYLYAAILGKVHYLSNVLAEYNYGVPNSWTERNKDKEALINRFVNYVEMLERVNKYYEFKYNIPITNEINKLKTNICYMQEDYITIKKIYKENFKLYNFKDRMIITIGAYAPGLLKVLRYFKGIFKN